MKVSVILPTFNEGGNIVALVNDIRRHLADHGEYEIIAVDDNSPDETYELVKTTFAGDPAVVPILRTFDRGLAKSIRAGVEQARGEKIVIMDTDFTHDPAEIPKLLHVGEIYDIVSGSRFCAGGRMQDARHYLASLLYNWYLRLLLRTQVQDNLGGFFTIGRRELMQLPLDLIFFGYGDYFFRLLYYAEANGLSIVELPAIYRVRTAGKSKSNFLMMLFTYTRAVVKLRLSAPRYRKKG